MGILRACLAVFFWLSQITIKCMTTIEEFADVSANCVLEQEFTTWVLFHIFFNIKNQVIKYTQHSSFRNLLDKLFLRNSTDLDAIIFWNQFDLTSSPLSEVNFSCNKDNRLKQKVNPNEKSIAFSILTCELTDA